MMMTDKDKQAIMEWVTKEKARLRIPYAKWRKDSLTLTIKIEKLENIMMDKTARDPDEDCLAIEQELRYLKEKTREFPEFCDLTTIPLPDGYIAWVDMESRWEDEKYAIYRTRIEHEETEQVVGYIWNIQIGDAYYLAVEWEDE